MKPNHSIRILLVIALCAVSALSRERDLLRKFLIGQNPPELISESSHWMGSSSPTTLSQLHGNVVWLQFNF